MEKHKAMSTKNAWPLHSGSWLIGAQRAWRMDKQSDSEKHYFILARPGTPYWTTHTLLTEVGDAVKMWLTRNGYKTPPDFTNFLARANMHNLPIGMIQFQHENGLSSNMKLYHATDMRGGNMENFQRAHKAATQLYPGLLPAEQVRQPIEALACRNGVWEYYTHANTKTPGLPSLDTHQSLHELGATCRQYSKDAQGTQTWYYTNMTEHLEFNDVIDVMANVIDLDEDQITKTQTAIENGAVFGDVIFQQPKNGPLIPVADVISPVNGKHILAP